MVSRQIGRHFPENCNGFLSVREDWLRPNRLRLSNVVAVTSRIAGDLFMGLLHCYSGGQ